MAYTYDPERFDTPERAIRFIRAERARRGIIAGVLGALAVVVTLGAVYVVYRDVPGPKSPANNVNVIVEPYH